MDARNTIVIELKRKGKDAGKICRMEVYQAAIKAAKKN